MAVYAQRVIRPIPFTLTNPVIDGQTLTYDANTGYFKNINLTDALVVTNTGTGVPLTTFTGKNLNIKSLKQGRNITFENDGNAITISDAGTTIVNNLTELNNLVPTSFAGRNALVLDAGFGDPAFYVYNNSWINISNNISGTVPEVGVATVSFDFNHSGPINVISLPPGSIIISCEVIINTVFNGSPTSLISVGVSGDTQLILSTNDIDTSVAGNYRSEAAIILPNTVNQQIAGFLTNNSGTTGNATIVVTYSTGNVQNAVGKSGNTAIVYTTVLYTQTSPVPIITLPGNSVVLSTQVTVNSPFNGTTPTLNVGINSDQDLLIEANEIDLTTVDVFKDSSNTILGSGSQQVFVYPSFGASTAGSATIFVQYSSP